MNIFYIHHHPRIAARQLCDKHVIKMILESAQMLSTAHVVATNPPSPQAHKVYKAAHVNHPSSLWVRASFENYTWLYRHYDEVCNIYTEATGKTHKSSTLRPYLFRPPVGYKANNQHVASCLFDTMNAFHVPAITPLPLCMPDVYKCGNAVLSYRRYYNHEKAHFATYNYNVTPDWFNSLSPLQSLITRRNNNTPTDMQGKQLTQDQRQSNASNLLALAGAFK